MGTQETHPFKVSADFEEDVGLASQRSSSDDGGHLNVLEEVFGETWIESYSEDEDQGNQLGDQISAAEWIEMQLLDCQNLARQQGLLQLASCLDTALDILAGKSSDKDISSPDKIRGLVVPFRCR